MEETTLYNEEKMVQKVASFEYEYDVTTYYKNTDGTIEKKYKEGYYGNTSIVSVTEEEIINKMNEIRLKVQKRKEERALYGYSHPFTRSGYTITKDLEQKIE